MTRRRRRAVVAAASGAALVLAPVGCGDDGAAAGPAEVRIGAGGTEELRFDLPAELDAGWTRLSLDNDGEQPHHAQLVRLADGATLDDLGEALATGEPAVVADVGSFVGGTALVSPGGTSRADAVVDLEPGRYAALCFVPDPDGVPHAAGGMVAPFTVAPAGGDEPDREPPVADGRVGLDDHRFELPDSLAASSTLAVENDSGGEPHELVLARLDDGAGLTDVLDALDAGAPMPAEAVGGVQALLPGDRQHLRLDLAPGRYALLCAVPAPDGTPHHRLGMAAEVEIR